LPHRTCSVVLIAALLLLLGMQIKAQTPEQMGRTTATENSCGRGDPDGRLRYIGFGIANPIDENVEMALGAGYTFISTTKIPSANAITLGFEGKCTYYPGDSADLSYYDASGDYHSMELEWFAVQGALLVSSTFKPIEYFPIFGSIAGGICMTKMFVVIIGEDLSPDAEFDVMVSFGGGFDLGRATLEGRFNVVEDLYFTSLAVHFKI
jgi:hypothetical protein